MSFKVLRSEMAELGQVGCDAVNSVRVVSSFTSRGCSDRLAECLSSIIEMQKVSDSLFFRRQMVFGQRLSNLVLENAPAIPRQDS